MSFNRCIRRAAMAFRLEHRTTNHIRRPLPPVLPHFPPLRPEVESLYGSLREQKLECSRFALYERYYWSCLHDLCKTSRAKEKDVQVKLERVEKEKVEQRRKFYQRPSWKLIATIGTAFAVFEVILLLIEYCYKLYMKGIKEVSKDLIELRSGLKDEVALSREMRRDKELYAILSGQEETNTLLTQIKNELEGITTLLLKKGGD